MRQIINWIVFVLYALVSVGVLGAALLVPTFRANGWLAYAPVRELLLPPPPPIVLNVLYSTEKEAWLTEVVAQLERDGVRVDGRPLQINLEKLGSREIYLAVLNGAEKPDLISPASMLQINILQDLSASKFGAPIVNPADQATCRPVVRSPLVLVAWEERAQVLWGDNPNGNMWLRLHDALMNPQGWAALGQPDWGFVKYGQTDPLRSNSGFMAVLLMTYNYFGKTSGLTSQDVLGDAAYQQWLGEFQNSAVTPFPQSTGPLMQDMIAIGPSRYDIVAVYEATALENAANAVGRYGALQVYYPPATLVSDHPFCLIRNTPETNWVTPEKERAAQAFLDYLTASPAQTRALLQHGFRPVNPTVSLEQPGSPFGQYAANGFDVNLPPEVVIPAGNTLSTLLDLWTRVTTR